MTRGIVLNFLGPRNSKWGSGVSHTPRPPVIPGKIRYPLYRRLAGHQDRSGRAESLVLTEIRSRTVQPVVSSYTDWAPGPCKQMFLTVIICGESWVTWDFMKIRVCVIVTYVCNKVGLKSRVAKCHWNVAGYAEYQTRTPSHRRVKSYMLLTTEACVCRAHRSLQFCFKYKKPLNLYRIDQMILQKTTR